jgi:hypothetical protein
MPAHARTTGKSILPTRKFMNTSVERGYGSELEIFGAQALILWNQPPCQIQAPGDLRRPLTSECRI